jgi:superfamily II DNA/RNA helicase
MRPPQSEGRLSLSALPVEIPDAACRRQGIRPRASAPRVTFTSLGVPAALADVLASAGITTPFPIQALALPDALAGRDVLGRGKTGSGKTLAFCIPLVAALAGGHTMAGRPRGLVLVPTRELASQVHAAILPLARATGLRAVTVFGGTPQSRQVAALRARADILIACPGRLADLIGQGHCQLGDVEVSVLDEADHMADLGFLPVVTRLLDATPPGGQRMMFSATLDNDVDVLVRRFLHNPARHAADAAAAAPAAMVHHLLTIAPADRAGVIAVLASGKNRALIFTRTRRSAQRLARQLAAARIPAAELHGNLGQATDIAARGIHVDGIDLVIHADPRCASRPAAPDASPKTRARTARGQATGHWPRSGRNVRWLPRPAQAPLTRAGCGCRGGPDRQAGSSCMLPRCCGPRGP